MEALKRQLGELAKVLTLLTAVSDKTAQLVAELSTGKEA